MTESKNIVKYINKIYNILNTYKHKIKIVKLVILGVKLSNENETFLISETPTSIKVKLPSKGKVIIDFEYEIVKFK